MIYSCIFVFVHAAAVVICQSEDDREEEESEGRARGNITLWFVYSSVVYSILKH